MPTTDSSDAAMPETREPTMANDTEDAFRGLTWQPYAAALSAFDAAQEGK